MKISGWGNYPVINAKLFSIRNNNNAVEVFKSVKNIIPRGLGRSYGDSSLWGNIFSTLKLNKLLSFDENKGVISLESGVSLDELVKIFVPRGWFLPVTPGTKFVTIGGAIASDVHGKNHHKDGTFSEHVDSMEILLSSGKMLKCSRKENYPLFRASCGGMGLTGVIYSASIRLKKIETAFIKQKTIRGENLAHIMDLFREHKNYPYSVAWIDSLGKGKNLGRSLLFLGEHARVEDLKNLEKRKNPLSLAEKKILNVPFFFPSFALNKWNIKAFNYLYYFMSKIKSSFKILDIDSFFYPLDGILNWNRMYGKSGFTQYQFVLPLNASKAGLHKILTTVSNLGAGSFLGVLKLFGKENSNYLSFPMEGFTLTLDFPINNRLFPLLKELDKIVIDYGGRIYLTKDVRMEKKVFSKGYQRLKEFKKVKRRYDKSDKLTSFQSKRVGL